MKPTDWEAGVTVSSTLGDTGGSGGGWRANVNLDKDRILANILIHNAYACSF